MTIEIIITLLVIGISEKVSGGYHHAAQNSLKNVAILVM
jgi:hypothetical protein